MDACEQAVIWRPIATLKPYERNPRTHSKSQIQQIARSIDRFGFTNPVLIDAAGGIIAGHGRVEAAKLLGQKDVPTLRIDHLSETEKRAYVIADNKLALKAGWDAEILAIELQGLLDLDFEVELTGFEMAEIDLLLTGEQGPEPDDAVPSLDEAAVPVTRQGDLWLIGRHRLLCGDALDPDCYRVLLAGAQAQMVFTDPPYNVPIAGHVSGLGTVKHGEFAMACGEMDKPEFTGFLATAFGNLAQVSVQGAIHYVCMDWRHMGEVLEAGHQAYSELKNVCVWAKTNGGMGSFYRSQHELVFVFKAGSGPHINNVELGRHGRYRTNLWSYAGANSFGRGREDTLALHPTVKPVALVADAILDASNRGGVVLDAFAGSGSTLLAAQRTGRNACALELDPRYCDVIVKRLEQVAGLEAQHAETGRSFAELAQERTEEPTEPEDTEVKDA